MLQAIDIDKSYLDRSTNQSVSILKQCSLKIEPSKIVGLMGPSGCGKSTLLRILLRLISCDRGSILLDEQDVTRASRSQLLQFRKRVQFVSQRPETFFDPLYKLGTSMVEPLSIFHLPLKDGKLEEVLNLVKLNKAILDRYPNQVSGGEIQRLSIARALMLEPEYLLLDEPTSMLDVSVQAQVIHLLKDINRTQNIAMLLVSHDKEIVHWLCDKVYVIHNGHVMAEK